MTQPQPILHAISLGAGVQSTTMALMAAHGEIEPMPDTAIFADTGAEPRAVYEHLDWLRSPGVLPFPVEVVQFSDLAEEIRKTAAGVKPVAGRANGCLAPPFFTVNADGSKGMLRRECTSNYKIKPIQRRIKELLGRPLDKPIRSAVPLACSWLGISADEWEALRASPEDWNEAVAIDRLIRDMPAHERAGLRKGGRLYVNVNRRPLEELGTGGPVDRSDLWAGECEGMCGI